MASNLKYSTSLGKRQAASQDAGESSYSRYKAPCKSNYDATGPLKDAPETKRIHTFGESPSSLVIEESVTQEEAEVMTTKYDDEEQKEREKNKQKDNRNRADNEGERDIRINVNDRDEEDEEKRKKEKKEKKKDKQRDHKNAANIDLEEVNKLITKDNDEDENELGTNQIIRSNEVYSQQASATLLRDSSASSFHLTSSSSGRNQTSEDFQRDFSTNNSTAAHSSHLKRQSFAEDNCASCAKSCSSIHASVTIFTEREEWVLADIKSNKNELKLLQDSIESLEAKHKAAIDDVDINDLLIDVLNKQLTKKRIELCDLDKMNAAYENELIELRKHTATVSGLNNFLYKQRSIPFD